MMRARYGSHAVEWQDGQFRFGVEPEDAHEVSHVAPASAVGAAFLSGTRGCPVLYIDRDGKEQHFIVSGAQVLPREEGCIANLPPNYQWALCGPGVGDPYLVMNQCRLTRAHTVTVCPFVDQQAAFGYITGALTLQSKEKPRMTRFCEPWVESLDIEGQEFDPKLEGDGFGRMAHLVQARLPVVNQMMRSPSIPVFYGRVLMTGGWWGRPVFLMLARTATKYFPTECLGSKNYAATWVPVAVRNTREFAKASGWGHSYVVIFVASELTPGLGTFLRFVETMGKEDFVTSSDPRNVPLIESDTIPLFRHHAAYNVSGEQFREVVLES